MKATFYSAWGAVAIVVIACAKASAPNGTIVPAMNVFTVPGPPRSCRATWVAPAPGCPVQTESHESLALPGAWVGDGSGNCALAMPPSGEQPRWLFTPDDAGYRGSLKCVLEACTSPLLVVVDNAPAPSEVLGEYTGHPGLQPLDPAIPTGTSGAIIAMAVPNACPEGEYLGPPITDWPPMVGLP